ncbi:hypothetical protein VNO78_03579 [Psophocarpus tetragonolobus]|uniref:Uncharacterized protein n=1 Tax=Psophocarpus tetragonolobus TaxID=3891 RepID=A0AAN9T0S5_PSOTE
MGGGRRVAGTCRGDETETGRGPIETHFPLEFLFRFRTKFHPQHNLISRLLCYPILKELEIKKWLGSY